MSMEREHNAESRPEQPRAIGTLCNRDRITTVNVRSGFDKILTSKLTACGRQLDKHLPKWNL